MNSTNLPSMLQQNLDGLGMLTGELVLIFGSILLLIAGVFGLKRRLVTVLYALTIGLAIFTKSKFTGPFFGGDMELTLLGSKVQYLLLVVALSLVLFKTFRERKTEYYFMILAILTGSLLMISTRNLLLVFLSVELASLPSYLSTAFLFKKRSFEAAAKYLVTGIVSSGIMLYGISLIYGFGGSLLPELSSTPGVPLMTGWTLLVVGILFKISAFPLHIWVPNTYEAAPTELVAFFSIVPKVAGLVLLKNLIAPIQDEFLHGLLLIAAILSIVVGTFSALRQEQVKRMLAYGAIAHSGFLLPIALLPGAVAESAFLFYILVYAVMNVATFYFVSCHEKKGRLKLSDLAGLGAKAPFVAGAMVVVMIALVGLPPTAGFSIKLVLFSVVWQAFELSGNYLLLTFVVVGILSSAVSLYFYLRIPYYCFMVPGNGRLVSGNWQSVSTILFFALLLILLFVLPNILDNFISPLAP